MPTELEAKISVQDHDAIRKALKACSAERISLAIETNHILDRVDGSIRRAGGALRVRANKYEHGGGKSATMTFKGPPQASAIKSREELEIEISDAAMALAILERLDCKTIIAFQKRRETWRCGNCLVTLDELPHIGLFVEVEGPDEASITAVLQRIGLAGQPHVRESYVGLLAQHCAERGINASWIGLNDDSIGNQAHPEQPES